MRNGMAIRTIWILVPAFLGLVAIHAPIEGSEAPSRSIQVAATVAPHAWLVQQIAGDDFRVVTVLPTSADPHSHSPTDAEVTRLARSRILFRAGVPFENGSWLRALAWRGVKLVDLRRDVELLEDEHGHDEIRHNGHGHDEDGHADHGHSGQDYVGTDPHTWTSPRRLAAQADLVAGALTQLRPDRAYDIRRRARATAADLMALDAELQSSLAYYVGHSFYVHHPSWSYFASDYGLTQVALEAGGSEPSDSQLTVWLRRARADSVRVVFTQPQSAGSAPRIAAAAIDARVESLDPLAADVPAQLRLTVGRLLASWSEPR